MASNTDVVKKNYTMTNMPEICLSLCLYVCTQGYFLHLHYAVYHRAGDARVAVNCVIAAVTWSYMWTNHRRSAFCVPYFTHSHVRRAFI